MNETTLDAGALIAFERSKRSMVALIARARERRVSLAVPAGVIAQVWRNGRIQARLAQLLASRTVEIEVLDDARARAAGQILGVSGTSDIVDASVVLCAQSRNRTVVTSDPDDLLQLDPALRIVAV